MTILHELAELRSAAASFASAEAHDRYLRACGEPSRMSVHERLKAHARLCSRDGLQEAQEALLNAQEKAKDGDGGAGRLARLAGLRELALRARIQALEPSAAQELLDAPQRPSVRPPGDAGLHGALPPIVALRDLGVERSRDRRAELEDALAQAALEQGDARSASWDATLEALGELGAGSPLEAVLSLHARGWTQAPEKAAPNEQIERVCARILDGTEGLARDLGAFFLERICEAHAHPGDAGLHDVHFLITTPPCASAFLRGELVRTARRFADALRLDLNGGGCVRLDELTSEERPLSWPLASAHPLDPPARIRVVLTPAQGPRALGGFLAALAESQRLSGPPDDAPPEDLWTCDPALAIANGDLLGALARTPLFLRQVVKLDLRRDDERALALADLFLTRLCAARTLASLELLRGGTRQQLESLHRDLTARAALCTLPLGLALDGLDPLLSPWAELRGRMLGARIREFFVERYDEDWFRNPRVLPPLQSLWVRGGRAQLPELWNEVAPGEAPSAEALVRDLVNACA